MRKKENRTVKTRIRVTKATAVFYNPLSAEMKLEKFEVALQKTFKTKEGLLNAVKKTFNTDDCVIVDVQNITKTDAIYECSFDDFMSIAQFVENVDVKED